MITFEQQLFETVSRSQTILAEYVDPGKNLDPAKTINELLGVLDNKELVIAMKEYRERQWVNSHPEDFEKYWPESGNVNRTKYYPEKQVLEIEFKNKKTYQYPDVPAAVWDEMKNALSIGSFIASKIKGHYRYSEV